MKPRLLLVATATRWLGTARMPRVFARAGFDVCLLTPPGSLAEKSAFVTRIDFIPARATPLDWLAALVGSIGRHVPDLLVPCDEMALRLLFGLVLDPPGMLPSAQAEPLRRLIVASLGDPAHYAASIDKTLLPALAASLDVPMPPSAVVTGPDDAVAQAEALGFPVVLKRRFGFAGEGVAFADEIDRVAAEARRMLRPDPLDLGERLRPQLLVQTFIDGAHESQAMASWHGRPLAAFAWERFISTYPRKGQTSVLRFVDSPRTRACMERLSVGIGITGLFNAQFIVDAAGAPYLLEINRRLVTHMHLGERVGCDLGAALFAALHGRPTRPVEPRVGSDDIVAIFPREWLRDPASPYLERYPADVPWDEPRLIAAMAAQWRER